MNVLITGQRGNIGTYLCSYLSKYYNVLGISKEDIDITDKEGVLEVLNSLKPDIVIHAAALTNIDYCEKNESEAYKINTIGSMNVAYSCAVLNIPILYLSTNYVYGDSKKEPYYETDSCAPINVYGKTKLAGEEIVRTLCRKYFIIRTSWVFGGEKCYVRKILANRNIPFFLCSSEVLNATYIEDLAYCIKKLISTNYYGVYNCANSGTVSKAELVQKVFNYMHIDKQVIDIPENYIADSAPRPKCSALNTYHIKNCLNIDLPHWSERLKGYLYEY